MSSNMFPFEVPSGSQGSAALEDTLKLAVPTMAVLQNGSCNQESLCHRDQQKQVNLLKQVQDTNARTEEKVCEMACNDVEATEKMHQLEEALDRKEKRIGEVLKEMENTSVSIATKEGSQKRKRIEPSPGVRDSRDGSSEFLEGLVEETVERGLESKVPKVDLLIDHVKGTASPQASSSSYSNTTSGADKPSSESSSASVSCLPVASGPSASAPSTPDNPALRKAMAKNLRGAARRGNLKQVRILLDAGADVNAANYVGVNTLMEATISGNASIVSLLLQHNALINTKTLLGHTALHYAAMHDRKGQCMTLLVNAGCAVDSQDNMGRTPLHEAASRKNEKAVRILLGAGASKTAEDEEGSWPCHLSHYSKVISNLLRC